VEWEDTCPEPQVESVVPVYNKTDVSGLQKTQAIHSPPILKQLGE